MPSHVGNRKRLWFRFRPRCVPLGRVKTLRPSLCQSSCTMSGAPVFCVLVLACALSPGQTYSPPMKTSDLSMDKNMCNDCTRIIELFLTMLSHEDTQKLIEGSLEKICKSFSAPKVVGECVESVQKHLPSVIKAFISFASHREGEICMLLGLCAAHPNHSAPQVLTVALETGRLTQVPSSTGPGQETQLQISPQCTFCLFIIKKLEDMLPKERTEESVVKLLKQICDHLPQHYKEQCNSFLENYGKQIIDLLLSSATPHAICMLLHLCLVEETHTPAIVPSLMSDCHSCKTLVFLTQTHLGQNASEPETSSMVQKMCLLHPNALPGCKLFIQRHGLALVGILSKEEKAINACQEIFCRGHE
ncbi:surfactant protein Bb isoform X1 [Brachyhypopomus gauderio]|uniref:surfactant protein Bb isoform X1 n=1 Tax=Brachyhypopomus gauderio TaxID=698409 RepID=UPI0040430666